MSKIKNKKKQCIINNCRCTQSAQIIAKLFRKNITTLALPGRKWGEFSGQPFSEIVKSHGIDSMTKKIKISFKYYNKAGIDTSGMQFCVLKIDRDKLQNSSLYKSGKMTFYYDPCYNLTQIKQLQDSPGIFTYNNIPRELIEDDFVMIP